MTLLCEHILMSFFLFVGVEQRKTNGKIGDTSERESEINGNKTELF